MGRDQVASLKGRNTTDEVVDHSLHGLASIRFVSAPPCIRDKARRRLGPSARAHGEPDITFLFKDSLPPRGRLRFLGLNEAAYDDDFFYLLDDVGNKVRIDVQKVGDRCEIVCERGVTSLPLLLPLIGLRLLRKGHVLLHSSCFVYEGKGILVAGWQKGGKTEMLLAFMAEGAAFVANEWTIVSRDGGVRGVGGVLQIWDWHFRSLPQYLERLPSVDRRRLALFRAWQRVYNAIPKRSPPRGAAARGLRRLSLEGGVSFLSQVAAEPERLFGGSVWEGPASLDRIFLATAGAGETEVFASDPREIARRMVASQSYERRQLVAAYDHFRFAFPDRTNELLEHARDYELRMLSRAFSGRAAYEIAHPYPVPLGDLYRAAVGFCG
jgi:hypothetical protein